MKRGLFLDLDGTLCDSKPILVEVWRDFLARFGVHPPEAEFERVNGPPLPEVVRRLKAWHGLPGTEAALTADYAARIAASHAAAPPAPGARDLLERARARGWMVAVVTSNGLAATRAWLARQSLAPLVDAIVSGDDVTRGKPDPEPYLLALSRTGCAAGPSLAVEDSPDGARAAAAAGLPVWTLTDAAQAALAGSPLARGRLDGLAALAQSL